MRRRHLLIGAGLTVGGTLAAPGAAQADTIAVTNLLDDASGGTLREAVDAAEASPDFDRILFDSGLTGDLNLEDGDIEIFYPLEIVGPGAGKSTPMPTPGSSISSRQRPSPARRSPA